MLRGHYDILIIFANPSAATQYNYLKKDKSVKIYPELDNSKIEELFRINEGRLQKKKPPVRFLVLFDDSLDSSAKNNISIQRCFIWGRINHVCPVLLTHNPTLVSPCCRANADYFVTFRVRTLSQKEYIWNNLLSSHVETKKKAFQIINGLVPYECLIADYTKGGNRIYRFMPPLMSHSSTLNSLLGERVSLLEKNKLQHPHKRRTAASNDDNNASPGGRKTRGGKVLVKF